MKCVKCGAELVRFTYYSTPLTQWGGAGYLGFSSLCVHEPIASEDEKSDRAETIARAFHEAYERMASWFGWTTNDSTKVPWEELPEPNRRLMLAVCHELLEREVLA